MPLISSKFEDVQVFKCGTDVNGFVPYWTHFYKLGDVLFDCGCPNVAEEIAHRVDASCVFITHHHEDHVGAAKLLKEKGARILAAERSLELIRNPPRIPAYRRIVWGQPEGVEAESAEVASELGIEVIETPGHSFDHVCYLVEDKLFSGDLVVSEKQMVVMRSEDCLQIIESLKKILKLDFSYAFGGVGIASSEEVERYLNYLLDLRDRARELYREGLSVDEIVEIVFPNPPSRVLMMEEFSGGEWARRNMVESLLGLRNRGSRSC